LDASDKVGDYHMASRFCDVYGMGISAYREADIIKKEKVIFLMWFMSIYKHLR
jgi:hypothetical protein